MRKMGGKIRNLMVLMPTIHPYTVHILPSTLNILYKKPKAHIFHLVVAVLVVEKVKVLAPVHVITNTANCEMWF